MLISRIMQKAGQILAVILLIAIILLAFTRAITPVIANYDQQLVSALSAKFKEPVTIGHISLHWRGLYPVFELHQVKLLDKQNNQVLLSIGEIDLGIRLFMSIWDHNLVLHSLSIKNIQLTLHQQADGHWQINGLNALISQDTTTTFSYREFAQWLSNITRVDLETVSINFTDKNNTLWHFRGGTFHGWHLLDFYRMSGGVILDQQNPTSLNIAGNFVGDIATPKKLWGHISVDTKALNLAQLAPYDLFPAYKILQGMINGTVQLDWHNLNIKKTRILLVANDLQIAPQNSAQIMIINNAAVDLSWEKLFHQNWQMNGTIPSITWQRFNHIPGVKNLSGRLDITPDNGNIILDSGDTTLDFGGLFRHPLHWDVLKGNINWKHEPDNAAANNWFIDATDLEVGNTDINISGAGTLKIIPGQSPEINLETQYTLQPSIINKLDNYLPIGIMNADLVKWLDTSIKKLDSVDGTFVLRGKLQDFPYVNAPGEFRIDGQLHNMDIDYFPGWPAANNIIGELIFSGESMQLHANLLTMQGIPVKNVEASIPVLGKASLLKIQSNIDADVSDGLRFIQNSPLKNTIGKKFNGLIWNGPMKLNLGLQIPIAPEAVPHTTQIQGNVELNKNNLQLPAWKIAFQSLKGLLQFTQDGITAKQLTAILFGNVTTISMSGTNITVQGKIAVNQLPADIAKLVSPYLDGSSSYQAVMKLNNNSNQPDQLTLTSTLQGATVKLPQPFAKSDPNSIKNIKLDIFIGSQQTSRYQINYNGLQVGLINQGNSGWQVNLNNPSIMGQIQWPQNLMQQGMRGQFQYLYLTSDNSQQIDQNVKPGNIPSLRLQINDMRYNNKKFGVVYLQTQRTQSGMVINTLQVKRPSYNIVLTGQWTKMTTIQGTLSSNDLASTLTDWNLPASIVNNNTQIKFNLAWPGAVYSPTLSKLSGNISLSLAKGRITSLGNTSAAKMDLGRLLSFLSFQSLARRIQFDFSDLTHSGLSFDYLSGNFQLANGQATTNNLKMDGPVAQVELSGTVDLANETYNLRVQVTPHITSSLPIIATIAGGPVAGAVTWVAGKIINPVVAKITTDNYLITGPWGNPSIKSQ